MPSISTAAALSKAKAAARQNVDKIIREAKNSVKVPPGVSRAEVNKALDKAGQEAKKHLR